jgi:hypothetical protein
MKHALAFGVFFIAMTASSTLAQEVVGIFPVQGTNLSEGETAAIGALIAVSYSAESDARVLDPTQTGPYLAQQYSPRDAARQLGLTQYVEVRAVRLEQRITLHAVLRNVHGSELYQVKTTAMSLDDMEPVAERIARSLHKRTPLEETRDLDNITGKEARAPNRVFAEKVFGIRTGMALPVGKDVDADAALFLEFDGRLEGKSYFIEFGAGFMLPSQMDDSDEGIGGLISLIGGSFYLSETNVAPYLGAGLSPRIMLGAFSGAALTANGHIGLMFMRMSSSRIYAEIGVDQHLIPLAPDYYDDEYYDPDTGTYRSIDSDEVWPTELSVAVGVGW